MKPLAKSRAAWSLLLALVLFGLGTARSGSVGADKPPADLRPTVAVLYFDYAGKDPQLEVLRIGLAQMLITDLSAQRSFRLVERERIEAVLKELKLASMVKMDVQMAHRIGRVLGARYLVLGSYFNLRSTLRLDAHVIEVETTLHLPGVGVDGVEDDVLSAERQLAARLAQSLATFLVAFPKAETPPASAKKARLSLKAATQYSQALHALDRGERAVARGHLEAVVQAAPDFQLASSDLQRLMQ